MPMKKTLLMMLLGLSFPLAGQDAWPLERCIQYALGHNVGIREKQVEAGIRRAELQQRQMAYLPVLSFQASEQINWGKSVDMQELVIIRNQLTHATGASVVASLPLFDGLGRHYQRRSAQMAVEVTSLQAADLRLSLEVDITRAYLELMLAKQIHAYTRESHATILQQRERTARLVEAGSQPKSALSEMEAQVAAEKANMVAAECRVRTATLSLTQLMNLPGDTPFVTGEIFGEEQVVTRVPVITDTQVEDYLCRDPQIRSLQATLSQLKYDQRAAQSRFSPTLGLTASYGTYFSSTAEETFGKQLDENRNPSISLQLTIPIFQAGEAAAQVRKSRLNVEMARLEMERVRTQRTEEIRSAGIEAENALQRYLSSEESLQAMQSLLEVTEAKYNLGAATALDYIIARNNRFKAVSDFLQAKWQYLFQLKLLERYRR